MSEWNSGSGGYITNFDDYYKSSSEESDDEKESKAKTSAMQEAHYYYSESEDEDYVNERDTALVRVKEEPPSKDWLPLSNDNLKLIIKPPENYTGYKEGAYPEDIEIELEQQQAEDKKKCSSENDVDPSTVDDADITSDYADLLKILCRICNKHIERDIFGSLHLKKHGMDVEDYKVSYGEPIPVKNSYHRCHLCQTIFVFTRSRLAGHLARHKISVKKYGKRFLNKIKYDGNFTTNMAVGEIDRNCVFSNDYEDECQTVCKICQRCLNLGNLGPHLYQTHSVTMKAGPIIVQWIFLSHF